MMKPIPVTAQSKAWVCSHLLAGIVGLNPAGGHGCLSPVSVVLSDRRLRIGLITRPEESYQVCCSVIVKPQ